MKQILIIALFVMPILCFSQKAEKIYSIAKKHKPLDYYHTQSKLWKKEIDKNSKNAEAWDNYYAASRMANLSTRGSEPSYDLDGIVAEMKKAVPNSYEYHKIVHWNTDGPSGNKYHLDKAYEINPDRPDIYSSMLSRYKIERNDAKVKLFGEKLYDSGTISPGVLAWNYNQLMSVEDNAILLTYGDTDTYAAWVLQEAKNVQSNVTVLNVHIMLHNVEFREAVLKDMKIPNLEGFDKIDIAQRTEFTVALIKHLNKHANRAIYLGVGIDREIIGELEAHLYLTGLAFKYTTKGFDNLPVLENNIENKFLLDNLKVYLHVDESESLLDRVNGNYLPAFVMLYKKYKANGDSRVQKYKALITEVATRSGQAKVLDSIL